MKNRVSNYVIIVVLLFIIPTLVWNCDKDKATDFGTLQTSRKVNHISGKDIPTIVALVAKKSRAVFTEKALLVKSASNQTSIDIENILEVINTEGVTNYTFNVIVEDNDPSTFFNLVVSQDVNGSNPSSYILKYQLEESALASFLENNHDFSKFTGVVKQYNIQAFFAAYGTSKGAVDDCNCDTTTVDGGTVSGSGGFPTGGPSGGSTGGGGSGGGLTGRTVCTVVGYQTTPCAIGNSNPHGSTESEFPDGSRGMCGGTGTVAITQCRTVYSNSNKSTSKAGEDDCNNPCPTPDGDIGVALPDDTTNTDNDNDCDTSKEDLKKIFPNASDASMKTLATVINKYGKDFGIDTKEKLQHFLAQAGHEVGEFSNGLSQTESLYYTTKSRLKLIFKKYFWQNATDTINKRKPDDYLRSSSNVANYVYCCRMGNGNEASGDGYRYRGRGIFQLTGKTNYTNFQTWYNNKYDPDKDFVSTPNLISSNDTVSILSALWFYKTNVLDKITVDSTTTSLRVTYKINGGTNGKKHRKEIFIKAKDSITCN